MRGNIYRCAARGSYPPVRVEKPNKDYAQILMDDFAGRVSEMTAVTQYLHHHWTIAIPEVSDLTHCIALVEMHHLDIWGNVIGMLRGDPRFKGSGGKFWNGTYPAYLTGNPCAQLRADLEAERHAIEQYRKHYELIDDTYIRDIINRIIKDEEHHIILWQKAIEQFCPQE